MELVETLEINGEEREIADAYARGQIEGINSNLTDLAFGENSGSANIFNGKIFGGLLIETGEINDWPTRITSDFIPVEPNTLYTQIAPTSAKKGRYCEYDANKNLVYFDPSGLQDTLTTKPTTKYLRISFGSEYGATFKNDIAIIKGNATEYVPYIMSNKQLGALNESLAYNASKNMLSAKVGTSSGVTITSKDKSTALLNGTSTANVSVFVTADVIPSGEYHLKVSNRVGSLYVWDSTHSKTIIDVNNTECNFTLIEPSKLLVGFSVGSGQSFTNFEVSGQLEKGTVATDFVPYNGKSNLELTNDVVSLKNDLGGLSFSVSGTTLSITNGTNTWTLTQ